MLFLLKGLKMCAAELKLRSVLVIDDDPIIVNSIRKQLRDENLNLQTTNDPHEGISLSDKNDYNLILCDIKMDKMNGLDVLRVLKDKHPELPVIILSGFVDDKIISQAKDIGCSDFLIKPVRKQELIDTINNYI